MLQGGDDWAPKIRNALIRSHIGKGFGTGLRRAHVGLGGWDGEGCPCKRSSASWDWTKRTWPATAGLSSTETVLVLDAGILGQKCKIR